MHYSLFIRFAFFQVDGTCSSTGRFSTGLQLARFAHVALRAPDPAASLNFQFDLNWT
ncbi:TPA: hypothetical protein ACPHTZ_000526 [Vibrio alginolyticus]